MGTDEAGELAAVLPGYDIEGELGRGAFGVVLAGRHRQLGRQVAIKRLPRTFSELTEVRHRFAAEAKILASLDHPHIVPIFDYVEQGGLCVLVMELLPGGTVRQRQQEGMTNQSACAMVLATCSALDFGHQHGILHRDVKPDNLLFTKAGLLKVTDFGIAKVVGDVTVTQVGETLGTPLYMAPEQCLNEPLSPATDVYSTGVMLYELLTGENPFGGSDLVSTMYRQIHEDPRPMREVNADIPASIEAVVARAMAKSPAARYRSARAFGGALAEAASAAWGSSWPAGDAVRIMSVGPIEAATGWPLVTGPIDIGFLPVPPTLDGRETIRAVEGDPAPAQPTVLTGGVEPPPGPSSQATVPWPETQPPVSQPGASWPPGQPAAPAQPSASGPPPQPAPSWPPGQPAAPAQPWAPPQQAASWPPGQPAAPAQPWAPPQQAASWPPAQPAAPAQPWAPPQQAPSWPPAQPAAPAQPWAPPQQAASWPPAQPAAPAQPWAPPQQAAPWPPGQPAAAGQPAAPAQPWATGPPAGPDPTQGLPYPASAVTAAQYAAPPQYASQPAPSAPKPGGRSRTPLLAVGAAVVVVIAIVAVLVLTKKQGGPPTPIATGGTTTVATTTAPTTASSASASQVASQINTLIQQSSTARNQVVSTINSIESCTANQQQAAAALASAVTTRRQVVQSLANLPVAVLPSGVAMQQALTQALNYSIDADHDYEGWLAGLVAAGGCSGQAPHDSNWSAAQASSTAATAAKDTFASLWNPVATTYGLPTVTSVTI